MNQSNDFDQKRMLLAVAASGAILLLWNYFFSAPPVSQESPDAAVTSREEKPAIKPGAQPTSAAAGAPVIARKVLETIGQAGAQHLEISNDDGQVAAWILDEEQYRAKEPDGSTRPFRFAAALGKGEKGAFLPPLLELSLGGQVVKGEYALGEGGGVVSYTDSKTGVVISRRYALDGTKYKLSATITLKNPTASPIAYDLTAILRGAESKSEASGGMFQPPVHLFESVCSHKNEFERMPISKVKDALEDQDDPTKFSDDIKWAGVDNRYFMTAVHASEGEIESCEFVLGSEGARYVGTVPNDITLISTIVDIKGGEIPAGGEVSKTVHYYGGPKKRAVLKEHGLEAAIDFGFFGVICIPMLWFMQNFYNASGNWGIAIILLTILVKIFTLPLTHKQYKSMAAMKLIQPQLKALQEKFKDDKAKLQQEMMKLYRDNKVNPLAGCLPLVAMMPIYFALYRTIYSAVELYQADFFLWISDLSKLDPYYITPLLLGVMMFFQTKLNPAAGDATQQKVMLYAMPIMFTFMMLFLPSGLVLYIMVNTVLGIIQQVVLMKRGQTPAHA